MPFSFSMEVIPWSTSSLALTGPMPATRMRSLMATLAGYVHGELLRAVPVLIDADGVVFAGAEPLLVEDAGALAEMNFRLQLPNFRIM